MEFDKPDKEVQRPPGNDVANQACSRSCGWSGELCEPSSVAAAVSAAEEHATRVPPQKCLKWQLQIRRLRCKCIILAGLAELAPPPPIGGTSRFGLAVPV